MTLCAGASNFVWLPVMGALSDRVGRRPLLTIFSLLALFTAYPVLAWLVSGPSFGRLLAVALWFSMIFGSYNGAMVVYLTEIMPAQVRASGFSLAYSLATGIFGGFTPAVCTYLIHVTGNRAMPGVWLSFAGAMGLTATMLLNTAANRRYTFGWRGPQNRTRHYLEASAVYAVGLAVSFAALGLVQLLVASPSGLLQTVALLSAGAIATIVRFVGMRSWVFHPGRSPR